MDAATFKLEELAKEAGVSARTVRYYVQRGLLPAPSFKGKDSAYGREHVVRLKAIRRLQERFLPLDAIQEELTRLPWAEIERIAEGRDGIAPRTVVPRVPEIPPPSPRVPSPVGERWRRITLAPGLELHVAEGVSDEVRALCERLVSRAGVAK